VPGYRRNSKDGRKICNPGFPVPVGFESVGPNHVESPGMGMSGHTQAALVFLHKFKMRTELFCPGIESFLKSGKVGENIMTQQDLVFRGVQDDKFLQRIQEIPVIRQVIRDKFVVMQPDFLLGQLGPLWNRQIIPMVRKPKNIGMLRDPLSSMHVMVAGEDDGAFFPDQVQACLCVPPSAVGIIWKAESRNIPQADQLVIALLYGFMHDPFKAVVILVDVRYDG